MSYTDAKAKHIWEMCSISRKHISYYVYPRVLKLDPSICETVCLLTPKSKQRSNPQEQKYGPQEFSSLDSWLSYQSHSHILTSFPLDYWRLKISCGCLLRTANVGDIGRWGILGSSTTAGEVSRREGSNMHVGERAPTPTWGTLEVQASALQTSLSCYESPHPSASFPSWDGACPQVHWAGRGSYRPTGSHLSPLLRLISYL